MPRWLSDGLATLAGTAGLLLFAAGVLAGGFWFWDLIIRSL